MPSRGVLGSPENTTSFPKLRALSSPRVRRERENAPCPPGASLGPSLAACFSNLPPRGADVQPPTPATQPQPSGSPRASPVGRAEPGRGAGGQRGHQGRDGAAQQPRPGPRRLRILNTHAHTRAHAGQSIRPEESEGAFTALHSLPKGEVSFTRMPPSRHPRGLQEGQLRHASSPPAHTHPDPLALQHDRQRRPRTGAAASPAPRSRRRAAPLRPAALRSSRPAGGGRHRREAPAAPESRRLPSHGPQLGGSRGGGARGRRRGRGAKVQAALGPAAPPSPPTPAPEVSPPGTGSHRRRCLPPPPPPRLRHPMRSRDWNGRSAGGSQPDSGREKRIPAYLPGAWKLPRSARGS